MKNIAFAELDDLFIQKHTGEHIDMDGKDFFDLHPHTININAASFTHFVLQKDFPAVTVIRQLNDLLLTCSCTMPKHKMCVHQAQALCNIIRRPNIRIFFDEQLRRGKLLIVAQDYGLAQESFPDQFFNIEYNNKSISITPKDKALFAVNTVQTKALKEQLLPSKKRPVPLMNEVNKQVAALLIFSEHKYYTQYKIELYQAEMTLGGKPKNILQPIDPTALIWKTDDTEMIKFYSAVARFQHSYETSEQEADIIALKALIRNPLALPVFFHNNNVSPNFTGQSLTRVMFESLNTEVQLEVDFRNDFYEISGQLLIDESTHSLDAINLRHNYFILHHNILHLISDPACLKVISYFRKNHNRIILHRSKFEVFRQEILAPLEHQIHITYTYLKPATQQQLSEHHFDDAVQQLLYLSDADNHVLITPVLKYGDAEVPALSRMNIYARDKNGTEFIVERNKELELGFLSLLLLQFPDFTEQLNNDCFYLPKNTFLNEDWFLNAFEHWRQHDITILGFNTLADNLRNPYKAKISVSVNSGLDWFETSIKVQYGKQRASLKHLHKAIRNKSRFVQLGDGTQGILPDEWLERFAYYFQSGDIVAEEIRTPKINFSAISKWYDAEVLPDEVKAELVHYQQRMKDFENVQAIEVPEGLHGTLRDYQHEGLNWLNYLDDLNFGGCLADDMGLGKTIQIIAFILSQRNKRVHNTNLVIVPTTLLFNWQAELLKFAPSLKVYTIHGNDRQRNIQAFDNYEVILTSYGTLLNDVRFLKEYYFNYIFLDESQHIKNPESQRYKAARLLQSRNKIVMTGTPVENNTFDLYGQLSFACPGLLGSKQNFKE